jgi:hypothetical protein
MSAFFARAARGDRPAQAGRGSGARGERDAAAGACPFSYLLKTKPDGFSDGLCRPCAHILPAHHNIYQRHLHREIGLCKRFSRCHDGDDAHLRKCSRRWWLCLRSQMDLLNISVQSLQSGTCSAGLWDDNLRHHGHHFGQGVVNLRWVHMPSPVCLWCASEGDTTDIW